MISYMMNYLLTESIKTGYSKINIMRTQEMTDVDIIEIFKVILDDIRKELNENIVNDGKDLRKVLSRMKLLLIYCNISEKFRKNYCCTEEDIRDMIFGGLDHSDNTIMYNRFADAIQSKREITEVFDRICISFKFAIECYFAILAMLIILSIIPSSMWQSYAVPDVCRAIFCGLFCLFPLAVFRLIDEIDTEKEQCNIRYFLRHHKEWMWATNRKIAVPGKFEIRINVDDLFHNHDHRKNSPIDYGMRAIKECVCYNALQNITFEDSAKITYDDVTYMKISLSEEAFNFIIGPKEPDDKEEQRGPLFNTINSVNAILKEYKAENGDESEDKFASLPQLKFHPPTTSKY